MSSDPISGELAPFQGVLRALGELLSAPSEDLPTVRCLSRTVLTRFLTGIRDQLAIPGQKAVSAKKLIQQLTRAGVIQPVPILDPDTGELIEKLFSIGFGTSASNLDPAELLLALEPRGVLCYFTALSYHSLTTQIAPFHHIAQLTDWDSQGTAPAARPQGSSSTRSFNPLGTERFVHGGQSYFSTARDRRLIPGIQSRYLHEKTILRITTLEQTLLDTLHRPLSCGGPEVVFEAWNHALDRLNEDRLADYLYKIDDPELIRRVGFLFQTLEHQPGRELAAQLEPVRTRLRENPAEVIPLFRGFQGSMVDESWFVEFP